MTITYSDIRHGDLVTCLVYVGMDGLRATFEPRTARAIKLGPCGWLLDMAGRRVTSEVCNRDNFISATRRGKP